MSFASARSAALTVTLGATVVLALSSSARAQNTEHDWQKEYSVSGSPSLTIETADSNLDIRSCGDCKAIRILVHSSEKLSRFHLEERQEQDHVYFTLKEKVRVGIGIHTNWKGSEATQVSVETPATLDLEAKTADGNFSAHDVAGNLQVHSGDGNVTLEGVRGNLHLTSSDGNISILNANGTLEARASDGHMKIDGQFTAVQLHTSDGNLDFALAPGSQLTSASRIESSDGRVSIRVPQNLAADLDVSTSDGHVDCALPLTMDHYSSDESSKRHLRGRLNAGGVPLSIHTSDGNVSIATL